MKEKTPTADYPLAVMSEQFEVKDGDRLVIVLRSSVWGQDAVQDITRVLDRMGLDGRYAILYLDSTDELHVVRAK